MSEEFDGSESPNKFNAHCRWLLKKMIEWENEQVKWDNNSKQRMNHFFRKEIEKNTALVQNLSAKIFLERKVEMLKQDIQKAKILKKKASGAKK